MSNNAKLNGVYTILSAKSGTAANVWEGSNQNRTPVKCVDMCLGINQRWIIEEVTGGYTIKNPGTKTYIGYHTDNKPKIQDGKEVTCNANKVVYSINGDIDNGVSIALVDQSLPFTLELDGEIVWFKNRHETPQPQQLWSLLPVQNYNSDDFKLVYKGPLDVAGVKRISRSSFDLDSNGGQGPHLWGHQTNTDQEGEEESYYIILTSDPAKSWELTGPAKEGTRIDIKPGRHQKWTLETYQS
ncbi:ricin-type beta-trefoil lectin domain protein [Ceratobasidium sp. AG-Ba]|nr:ricin-type beta-trefoil lectin domain protein [Ceratobasidium sp. AG-Ba]